MKKQLYIVGLDGSEWSERAAERAINLASQTGARVELVYILDVSRLQPMIVEGVAPPILDAKDEEGIANETVIAPIKNKYKALDVEVNSVLAWGDPVDVLHDRIKKERANMVFVGRRGRSRFANLLLGSVANKLAHCTSIPIVLVP